jgi:hypothetical protein
MVAASLTSREGCEYKEATILDKRAGLLHCKAAPLPGPLAGEGCHLQKRATPEESGRPETKITIGFR